MANHFINTTDEQLLRECRSLFDKMNQADTDEYYEELDDECDSVIAEMERRGLSVKQVPKAQ